MATSWVIARRVFSKVSSIPKAHNPWLSNLLIFFKGREEANKIKCCAFAPIILAIPSTLWHWYY